LSAWHTKRQWRTKDAACWRAGWFSLSNGSNQICRSLLGLNRHDIIAVRHLMQHRKKPPVAERKE
jgi:hypothetical protein